MPRRPQRFVPVRQCGLTLIELMIAMTLGMGVILMAGTLLLGVKNSYLNIHDSALMEDSARHALEVIAQALRQANFVPHDDPEVIGITLSGIAASVHGLDNSQLTGNGDDIQNASQHSKYHRSDVLAVQFFGAADASQLNCAGFAAPRINTRNQTRDWAKQRSWSIFFIGTDSNGIPELRCKYATHAGGWSVAAVARGIEALHVLYGIGDADSGNVTTYLPAARMSTTQWEQVMTVRVALLVRGEHATGEATEQIYHLFGKAYQNGDDAIVTIGLSNHPRKQRKIFSMTIRLRNAPAIS
jgi:type IV pilus assembly protein PilW